jgi:hypothetical protein
LKGREPDLRLRPFRRGVRDQYPIRARAIHVAMLIGSPTAAMTIEYSEIFTPFLNMISAPCDGPLFRRYSEAGKLNQFLT